MHLPCAPAPCTLLLLLLATAVAGLELVRYELRGSHVILAILALVFISIL
jgi:hypothetical protein